MFAVDHAATALLLKRRYPSVPITPLLLAVQAMELAWVAFNYLGLERTTTELVVRSVADIHLAWMPYSHSVMTALGSAVLAWVGIEFGMGRRALGRAVGIGIASHLALDPSRTRTTSCSGRAAFHLGSDSGSSRNARAHRHARASATA
jgi:hypothetical protein